MKVVAFLPAKGSSERIESKNLKLLDGKPLFLHTLEKLVDCDFIDEVYLDSESDAILEYASYLDYIPLKRAQELANNKTDGHQMFYNEIKQVEADIYIQILGTSPFISPETIQKGINVLLDSNEYDSAVLVRREKQYTWNNIGPNYDINHIPNSKDLNDTIIETMGLYIVKSGVAHRTRKRIGEKPYLIEADAIEAIDVNYPDDFALADIIAKGIKSREVSYFNVLSNHLSSCMLSDILWDMGMRNSVITGLKLNISHKKILGRANTLKLRQLKEKEDFKGIYKGLETYNEMRYGDVIVVENECAERAYFGDLNCNLAIRAGALGTIIDGVTRDINKVSELDYPILAKGYCCTDVRGVATVEAQNKVIKIRGVEVYPGDLIFADINGIVVIPRKYEQEVLKKALETIKTERNVVDRILLKTDAYEIYKEEGAF